MTIDGATEFEPHPTSAARVRHFVVDALDRWGLERLSDDAALCAAELATNAILHCRRPFTVAVRHELAAVGELVAFLERLARTSDLGAGKVPAEVEGMRAWLPGEVAAQYQGRAPSAFAGGSSGGHDFHR
jgi:hypothetical protein